VYQREFKRFDAQKDDVFVFVFGVDEAHDDAWFFLPDVGEIIAPTKEVRTGE